MALGQTILDDTRRELEYHRVVAIHINDADAKANVIVYSYADAAARQEGGAPGATHQFPTRGPEEWAAVKEFNALQLLDAQGVDTSAWPAPILAVLALITTRTLCGTAAYEHVKQWTSGVEPNPAFDEQQGEGPGNERMRPVAPLFANAAFV
jgi:hypothetical protein